MKRLYLLLALIPFALTAQTKNLVKCEDKSSYWVIKSKGKIFTIHLHGDVAPGDVPELMNVEEMALHYNLLDKSAYLKKGGGSNDAAVLTRFIKGEEKVLGDKMKPVYKILKLPSGKPFLLWHHDWHGTEEMVEQQVHATIVLGEAIIWLSAPKFTGQDIAQIEAFLTETIGSVKAVKSVKDLCGQK
ncbi:hypothetical protein HYN59_08940 [Flavobacterium album]|uniref:Uncharacterized protein n=1 Tax=Flavobacterium album TaxID=2175091 RepID=A0A2S1QXX1_9FLAO|nr:hypothetical protein [Flavobacterium album]AWH85235.1 hypothetical protein HYN59_08940 [Flavobacterium album]